MPDPSFTWNRDPVGFTATLSNGYQLAHLLELSWFDQLQVNFPTDWSTLQTAATLRLLQMQWQLNASTILTNTLNAGASYTRADGASESIAIEGDLLTHLWTRPTSSLDLTGHAWFSGTASRSQPGVEGGIQLGLKLTF